MKENPLTKTQLHSVSSGQKHLRVPLKKEYQNVLLRSPTVLRERLIKFDAAEAKMLTLCPLHESAVDPIIPVLQLDSIFSLG